MEVSLEILSGAQAGDKIPIEAGRLVRVGRGPDADIAVAVDLLMSESHFAFWWNNNGCRIRDLRSARGTFLNGQKISEAAVRDGDKFVVGQTHFVVRVKRDPETVRIAPISQPRGFTLGEQRECITSARTPPEVKTEQARDLLEILRNQPQPLFAILDAARDPKVLGILRNSDLLYQSLYEGPKGEELAEFAPYLVELPSRLEVIRTLLCDGWGKSWGIFLTSGSSFKDVRRHFRHFLVVRAEDGRELYFRFYDPRVLRVFFPTCTSREASEFFGPVSSFLVEGEQASILLKFICSQRGVQHEAASLTISNSRTLSTDVFAATASLASRLWY